MTVWRESRLWSLLFQEWCDLTWETFHCWQRKVEGEFYRSRKNNEMSCYHAFKRGKEKCYYPECFLNFVVSSSFWKHLCTKTTNKASNFCYSSFHLRGFTVTFTLSDDEDCVSFWGEFFPALVLQFFLWTLEIFFF